MKTNLLKKLFYPPNYLSMTGAGIDIRNSSIKYMEFFDKKGILSIQTAGEVSLAAGIVKDGEILNADELVKALVEVKKKLSGNFVKVSIPEEKTYIFDMQIPKVADSEIRQAIEFKLEENVPLKAEEVDFEYEVIHGKKDAKDMIALSVSVIPKNITASFAGVLERAGLIPLAFEIESRMLARAVIAMADHRNFIIVDIKENSTLLSFVVANIVRFTSTIPVGDSAIRESLIKVNPSLYQGAGKLSDTFFSVETSANPDSFYSLFNVFSVIKDELEKFHEYLVSEFEHTKNMTMVVDQIIFAGRSAALPGFTDHVGQNLNIEIVLANVWSNIFDINDALPALKFTDSLDFAAAVGLGIPSF